MFLGVLILFQFNPITFVLESMYQTSKVNGHACLSGCRICLCFNDFSMRLWNCFDCVVVSVFSLIYAFSIYLYILYVYLLIEFACGQWCPICIDYVSSMSGVLWEARDTFPLRAPSFTPGFWWGTYSSTFQSFCVVFFCFVYLYHVSCVPNVACVSGLSILDCSFVFL